MFALWSSQVDEISDYQNARYVSSNEAAWRLLEFPIHERDPTIQQLAVYLENGAEFYIAVAVHRPQRPVVDLLMHSSASYPHANDTYLSTIIRVTPPIQWVAIGT